MFSDFITQLNSGFHSNSTLSNKSKNGIGHREKLH